MTKRRGGRESAEVTPLAVIGAGKMAEAIVRAGIASGALRARSVVAADVDGGRQRYFQKRLGVRAVAENAEAVREAQTVLLSVKPQAMGEAVGSVARELGDKALVISIAAGVPTRVIEGLFRPRRVRVVRAMPNTPMLIGQGIVAVAAGKYARPGDLTAAERLFAGAAEVVRVPEKLMDAVTAVSGSGPAYIFYLVEQMTRAGMELGLKADVARRLAAVTAAGAGAMLRAGGDAGELRRAVTSPGGTTQAAIEVMSSRGWDRIARAAIAAACRRGRELGRAAGRRGGK
jgi:pyrroline-5-carboxylate reductase